MAHGKSAPPFAALTPETLLAAVESTGLRCDGRLLTLNSFENRVFQIGLDQGDFVVAKFYRPARWTNEAIQEEHTFAAELVQDEVPVVAPLRLAGQTLHQHGGFRFAVYPRQGGRAPEFDNPDHLTWMGRFLARIHVVGARSDFCARPDLDVVNYGDEPRDWLVDHAQLPSELENVYFDLLDQALNAVEVCFEHVGEVRYLRLHGDCHAGNVLWTDHGPHFVDLDDARQGPAVQDLWMLLSGNQAAMSAQMRRVLAGYRQFREFDTAELDMIEGLRTLRLIHYTAWLARRWHDPAFPAAFPWFGTPHYWQERILELREQLALLDSPEVWAVD